jgi:unspecific monooxygenase
MAREICSTPSGYRLSNIQRRLLGPILGDGLTLAEGETWREQRRGAGRLSGEALRSCASNSSLDAMVRQELSAWSESDGALDVLSALKSAALNLIARTMFSTSSSIASPEVMTAVREVEACLAAFDWADGVGAPAWFRTRKMRRAEMAARQFDSEIMDTLRACQRAAQGRDNPSALETVSNRDFVISMLSGFESVALSVFWGMIELARDDGAIARHGLDAFIDEVLRLYPPLPFILRVAQDEDRRFGKIVPRNALICISPWLLQRHELYWDNPSAFMPGRFQATGTRPDAFIPFGLGARRCIGMHLARRLIAALLSEIHAKWRLEVADGSSPRPIAGVSLRPSKPVSFTLTLRRLA